MINIEEKDLPGLYNCADKASQAEQKRYFIFTGLYLCFLILAATFAYIESCQENITFKIVSTLLFFSTLGITVWLRVYKPDDVWYNGRAVAESVKTRSWRWMMKAEPYTCDDIETAKKEFIKDLRTILSQNQSLIKKIGPGASSKEPVSDKMISVRNLSMEDRFIFYRRERVTDQEMWYTKKAKFNKKKSTQWFVTTIILHAVAILALLYNIQEPLMKLPIEVIATAASSILTWAQAKKYNELYSSYSLTAHEIVLIKNESTEINNESQLSEYIINCENAFSREHTQWFARRIDT